MVDAQFVDDKYIDVEERNKAAIDEANRRAAEREAAQPKKKTKAELMSERALAIQAAAQKAEHGSNIILDEFSKYAPNGETISVRCKRITPQELLAGDLLPANARKMVSAFAELGIKATASERSRVGLDITSGEKFVEEVFDGDPLAAAEAYGSLVNAICIATVKDPDIRLYWNEKAKGDDRYGLMVDVIPLPDREKIANWALEVEEKAASTVAPFLQRPENADRPVSAVEKWDGKTERADQV